MMTQLFSERTALIVITLIGMAFCTQGIGQVAARGDWLHPIAILGYLFGVLILAIVAITLFGGKLPMLPTVRVAMIAVVLIAVAKIVLAQVYTFVR